MKEIAGLISCALKVVPKKMLYESDIINAVSKFLNSQGYKILQNLTENQRGDDIIAVSLDESEKIFIEAKGETSSKKSSARFGKAFSRGQVRDHVANAFYKAAQKLQNNGRQSVRSGIALPKKQDHIDMVKEIRLALATLQIEVFWVHSKELVEVAGNWKVT